MTVQFNSKFSNYRYKQSLWMMDQLDNSSSDLNVKLRHDDVKNIIDALELKPEDSTLTNCQLNLISLKEGSTKFKSYIAKYDVTLDFFNEYLKTLISKTISSKIFSHRKLRLEASSTISIISDDNDDVAKSLRGSIIILPTSKLIIENLTSRLSVTLVNDLNYSIEKEANESNSLHMFLRNSLDESIETKIKTLEGLKLLVNLGISYLDISRINELDDDINCFKKNVINIVENKLRREKQKQEKKRKNDIDDKENDIDDKENDIDDKCDDNEEKENNIDNDQEYLYYLTYYDKLIRTASRCKLHLLSTPYDI